MGGANGTAANCWPADVLYTRLHEMLIDGALDEAEHVELLALCARLPGGDVPLHERVASYSSQLPLTKSAPGIDFSGRVFCLTGKFILAARACDA
jgi:hypothetical protein